MRINKEYAKLIRRDNNVALDLIRSLGVRRLQPHHTRHPPSPDPLRHPADPSPPPRTGPGGSQAKPNKTKPPKYPTTKKGKI